MSNMLVSLIRVVQLNGQRSIDVSSQMRQNLEEEYIDILLLQEPYVYRGIVKGYGLNRVVTGSLVNPQAAIIIRNKNLVITRVESLYFSHGVCVEIVHQNCSYYLISVHFQFSDSINQYIEYLDNICAALKGKNIIIAMDANARSPL